MEFFSKAIEVFGNIFISVMTFLIYGVEFVVILVMFSAIFLLPPVFILRLPQWFSSHKDDSYIKIKYSTFISMYNMNPYAWELEDDTVLYCPTVDDNRRFHLYQNQRKTYFYFNSYIDYRHYRSFLNKVRKEKKLKDLKLTEEKNYEELEKVLNYWKNDIEEYKKNADAEIKKKLDKLWSN